MMCTIYIIIVAFLQNATIEYSSEAVCMCMCVCVSVFLHDNSKSYRSSNMKLEYVVGLVYENISDNFDIGHCQTKVKVTGRL